MSRNASGTYTLPSGNPVVSGTLIEATWANSTLSDIATALTGSLSRSAEGGMLASLRLFDGTSSVPGLAWGSETTTGFYRAGAGDTRLVVTGSQVMQFLSTGVSVTGTLGVTGAATLSSTLAVTGAITATGGVVGNVTGNVTGNVSGNAGTVTNGVYTTGDQTIGGVKRFSSSISAGGSNVPATNLDVQTTGSDALTSVFTTGVSDLNFRAGFMNGVAGSTGSMQARMGLFYLGVGEVATIGMYRGATSTDGSLALRTAGNDRLTVTSAGDVGIGTSSPAFKLDVSSTARATNWALPNDGFLFWGVGTAAVQGNASTNIVSFLTSGSERARIDSSGNLLVGTTSSNGRLNVSAPNDTTCVYAVNTAPNGAGGQIAQVNLNGAGVKFLRVNTTNVWEIVNSAYSAVIFQVTNAGQCFNATGTYGTISDIRLKENVSDARGYLEDICKLRVVKYSLKSEEATQATKLGFIAQEVEQVFPGMVEITEDKLAGLEDMKQLKLSVLTPMLVKAIQEQQAIIEQLKADVAALKSPTA